MSTTSEGRKIRLQANTRPCLQCAWVGKADECRYKQRTQSCERCLELKDSLQCSGVKGRYADQDDLDVPTLVQDVYSCLHYHRIQMNSVDERLLAIEKALGIEQGSVNGTKYDGEEGEEGEDESGEGEDEGGDGDEGEEEGGEKEAGSVAEDDDSEPSSDAEQVARPIECEVPAKKAPGKKASVDGRDKGKGVEKKGEDMAVVTRAKGRAKKTVDGRSSTIRSQKRQSVGGSHMAGDDCRLNR
ncbi:hypothetical protein DICSQDRAFT_130101 [Dichomitus squalens LYAD-421 SS1]|uniref:Uncharacterized protein n=2 Tax=Dichomitus squalens TaxID=114155 RepID=R7SJY8_DICSQ|nr:uncharacterized protein DICSQDRAFT_130101 [Dichomitus squalens LYAD-421 SS1]EJF56459.1 hypothetical protein DICSQDRAFT_130101 [Dichomitus squalens LYAD-421 SS1]